jgi:hypothetical protein
MQGKNEKMKSPMALPQARMFYAPDRRATRLGRIAGTVPKPYHPTFTPAQATHIADSLPSPRNQTNIKYQDQHHVEKDD